MAMNDWAPPLWKSEEDESFGFMVLGEIDAATTVIADLESVGIVIAQITSLDSDERPPHVRHNFRCRGSRSHIRQALERIRASRNIAIEEIDTGLDPRGYL